jgi:MoaA/NifB/PqqE/SkfB family radical SAM enzyme
MNDNSTSWAQVDESGRLILPAEVTAQYGLNHGAQVRIDRIDNYFRVHRPVTHLAKVYVEPTNKCNLVCSMCMHRTWEEPQGEMSWEVFTSILDSIKSLPEIPTIFFGGLGEPLSHPHIIRMISRVKALHMNIQRAKVELITNGTLLDEDCAQQLVDTGLDRIWFSIDGATPESYADIRLGAALPEVLNNIKTLKRLRSGGHFPKPEIGIVFVAMKSNIADLPAVIRLGRKLGAKQFLITNVLPYSVETQGEMLYQRTLRNITYLPSKWFPKLNMPKMQFDEYVRQSFFEALNSGCNVIFSGQNLGGTNDVCTFIESGSITVAWDGNVSPCPPLSHNHLSFLHKKTHLSRRYVLGNITEHGLFDLWNNSEYVAYRQRVQEFAFAPCSACGGCDLSESNEEDCYGNTFPACGGCLWAQGVIQCP